MSNDTNKEINTEPTKIKFDFDQAKTTTQQSLEIEDAAASGQELDEESPTQHKFVRFRGKSWEDLLKVHGVKLSSPGYSASLKVAEVAEFLSKVADLQSARTVAIYS